MKLAAGTPVHVSLAFAPNRSLPVGRLALDRGRAVLEYTPAFIASGLSISPRLGAPVPGLIQATEPRLFEGLHGVFADSLPDAWGRELMRRRAIAHGIEPGSLTVLDQLAIVGHRGMGALVYEPAVAGDVVDDIDLDVLSRESMDVLAGRPTDDHFTTLAELGASSGGARPKILVAIDGAGKLRAGTDAIPPGYDAWIVKFRAPRDRADVGPLEAAYADMARAAGIDVAPTMLLPSRTDELGYFATKRFDRGPGGTRVHAVSVAGMFELQWEIASIDYNTLLNAVRFVTRQQPDVERMLRRMVFNVAAHNRDDHAKQHAFLMNEKGTWRLAPAYDLNFTAGPGGEHYLAVNGRGTGISRTDVLAIAARQSVSAITTGAIIDDVLAAVDGFDRFAAAYDVAPDSRAEVSGVLARHIADLRARPDARTPVIRSSPNTSR